MIVSFFGHADFRRSKEHENTILSLLAEKVGDAPCDMFLGGYGGFDIFAYDCCKKYQESHPHVSLVLITPYLGTAYQHSHLKNHQLRYDTIVYPALEDRPKRFAISYRNKYMVEKADLVIAYIDHDWGGAYRAYQYARRKGKLCFNITEERAASL